MILIIGAGLSGLSAAWHLRGHDVLVLEKEREPGGLARSVSEDGFTFDFTGHLLHTRDPQIAALCDRLLGADQVRLERRAFVQHGDRLVPYPFQANIASLPDDVRVECVKGFVETLLPGRAPAPGSFDPPARPLPLSFLNVKTPRGAYALSFVDWAKATFGDGFTRHFFEPYNAKNFACDVATISADWVSWAIPKPALEDVLRGAMAVVDKAFGYNPRFVYPASGGIRRLPDAFARELDCVKTTQSVVAIDAVAKVARLADGSTVRYDLLLTTQPLPELIAMTTGLDAAAYAAVRKLRWCSVASFNFGVDGTLGHDRHWVYYPDRALPFYRAGFPTNLTPAMAPPGKTSICAEVAYAPDRFPPNDDDTARVRDGLVACGALDDAGRVTHATRLDLPYAYVLFDDARRAALPVLFEALVARDVIPLGRYGSWNYLSMEDSIAQGIEAARYAKGGR